jgi:DNA polymerase-1
MRPRSLYIVDGSAIVYRSHFAFSRTPLVNSKGENVSAVYGFAQAVLSVLKSEGARYAAVAFDAPGPTFRHERFEAYKANRPGMPDELVSQLPLVRELTEALGIPVLEQRGVEADDLIASLATTIARHGDRAVIVSIDKDFQQLVTEHILQWIPPRGREPAVTLGPGEVEQRWGVPPERVLDVLALMGDSVDNVPGVEGIGPKTASELVRSFGDLDSLYEKLDAVPRAAVREKLRANRDMAYLSRDLIRLRTDLLPDEKIESYAVPDPADRPDLLPILRRLEFRRLIELLGLHPVRPGEPLAGVPTRMATAGADLVAFLEGSRSSSLGIDLQMEGDDPRTAPILGFSLADPEGGACYVPLAQDGARNLRPEVVRDALAAAFAAVPRTLVTPEGKPLLHAWKRLGWEPEGGLFDIRLAAYLLDPEGEQGLDALGESLLGLRPAAAPLAGGKSGQLSLTPAPEETARRSGDRSSLALRIHEPLERLLRERSLETLLREIEVPLTRVIVAMERAGVHVEAAQLRSQSEELAQDLAKHEAEIHRLAGRSFNILSPQQLGEVLFETLKLPTKRKTKTGYSTDQDVLEELAPEHPIARVVLDYRQLSKLRSTYLEALPKMIDPSTGRIHGRFHQTVAATGRLSSTDPNLQNIPIRTPQGRRIRQAFTPQRPGEVLISADYSQIELRILAHLSQDPGLLAAFRAGEDIHAATAARIFDRPIHEVDAVLRGRAKTVNFGVLYGMGPHRLAREMGIPFTEARAFIEQYFAKMPGVKRYLEENLARARQDGVVTTLLGRRRPLPALRGDDGRARAQAERIAANTPIQGSAADLIKKAMVIVHDRLNARDAATRLILQVHDELLLEGPADEAEEVADLVKVSMEGAVELSVPLTVEVGWGSNWEAAHAPAPGRGKGA